MISELFVETGLGQLYFDDVSNAREVLPIELIARSLSRECRFMGLIDKFYSVAEHCVLVSHMCKDDGLEIEGLMHDMAEAVTRDIPTPLKEWLGPQFKDKINDLERRLAEVYEVPNIFDARVKCIDKELFKTELLRLDMGLIGLTPKAAEKLFLRRYYELRPEEKKRKTSCNNHAGYGNRHVRMV